MSPEKAEQVLHNDPFDVEYETLGGEERFVSIGHTNLLRVLRVVRMLRGDAVRVITAHDVSAKERRAYFRAVARL